MDFQSLQANYYLSAFPHPLASPAWAATTTQQASDAIANTQRQWNDRGGRSGGRA